MLFFSGIPAVVSGRNKRSVKILLYHRICEHESGTFKNNSRVTPSAFHRQIKYLHDNGYSFISLQEIAACVKNNELLPYKTVAITFDDGYRDNYLNAWPVLKKYNVPATIFVTTSFIKGKHTIWLDTVDLVVNRTQKKKVYYNGHTFDLSSAAGRYTLFRYTVNLLKLKQKDEIKAGVEELCRVLDCHVEDKPDARTNLSWDEVTQMQQSVVSFGAHGCVHISLAHQSDKTVENEIVSSKRAIEQHTGTVCDTFAYPYGQDYNYDGRTISILRDNGFVCACAVNERFSIFPPDLLRLTRISIEGYDSLIDFKCKLSGISVLRLNK